MTKQKSMGQVLWELSGYEYPWNELPDNEKDESEEKAQRLIAEHERRKRAKDLSLCNREIIAMQMKCKRAKAKRGKK